MKQLVIAIGGNAILPADERRDAQTQRRLIDLACERLAELAAAGYDLVVTHGNGPQVGDLVLQNEESRGRVPAMPLDVCVAESQAQIGYMFQQGLANAFASRGIRKDVACVITRVLVDVNDEAFRQPTKPIGPYYMRDDELIVKRAKGWKFAHDPRGGFRRVVPSPRPLEILEAGLLAKLANQDGCVVIAAGGGGVPVVKRNKALYGVEAVVDKDLASALLAKAIGWKELVIVTDVPHVALDFGRATERPLDRMTVREAKKHLADGQFAPGSMGPKVEAAIEFLHSGGERVVVTDLDHVLAAVGGKAGTVIVAK